MSDEENNTTGGFRLGYQNGAEQEAKTLEWIGGPRPEWLRTRYLKNGAGIFKLQHGNYKHWFDGLALLKQFEIEDEITYRASFLRSPDYVESTKTQRVSYTEFATAPDRGFWKRIWSTLDPNSQFGINTSINLQQIDGKVVAIGDLPKGMTIDPATLATTGEFKIKKVTLLTSTPHPQRDDARKAWYNLGIGVSWTGFGYHVYCMKDGSRKPDPVCFITRWKPAYMHSIAMTERYVVVAEHPMFASLARFFTLGLRGKPILNAFSWQGSKPMTLFIVDKEKKDVAAKVEAPAGFYFHSSNAFDQGDEVVVDLCTYKDDEIINDLFLKHLEGPNGGQTSKATLTRHRINVATNQHSQQVLTQASVEFPKVNPGYLHHQYKFTYAVSINDAVPADHTNQLVKVNVETGETHTWFEPGCYPNEPFMIPRPGSTKEDDGIILSVVLNAKLRSSMLLMLDAETFTEIGRAMVGSIIPFGLHGQIA